MHVHDWWRRLWVSLALFGVQRHSNCCSQDRCVLVRSNVTRATRDRAKLGIRGIDIDAEGQVENLHNAEVMGVFMTTLRKLAPRLKISLCVYGSAEGRTFHNYLVNNFVNNVTLIDWINVMAYAGYDMDTSYIETYTHAPRSKWDHPIDQAVPASKVVVGMKATGAFGNCSPPDYTKMVQYVKANGVKGISIWAFLFDNSTLKISWWKEQCAAGYVSTFNALGSV
mmetsp:Transcript_35475/g.82541  ORF Transcript_35475/g.82541 Transcript_35475/m.82541 type:complete len:225 (-) Transcript_35475:21-695(-)